MLPVVILCGGLSTRLYPITKVMPKSLIEVYGKPFIWYQLNQLRQKRVTDVILCVGKFGDAIEKTIGNKFGNINIKYSYDGDKLLGTGGAIKKALPLLLSDDFFILYGDSYLSASFHKMMDKYKKCNKPLLMTIFHNKNKWDKSNIVFNGEIINYNKKLLTKDMEYIDYGISIINKSAFENYPDSFDLSDLYSDFVSKKEATALEITTPFFEIGSFKGLEKFKKHIKK